MRPRPAAAWPPAALAAALLLAPPRARPQDAPLAAAPPETFATAEALGGWSFSNGPEWPGARGTLEWRPDAGRSGDGAAVLSYDFAEGGHYVAAIAPLPAGPAVRAVRLWLHKPAANLLIFRAVDADGEAFQKNVRYHYPGWQQLEIELGGWEFSWGGDGRFAPPPREFHILVENDGGTTTGTLRIDDVQWLPAGSPAAESGRARATCVESDFSDVERWRHAGAAGGEFASRRWSYRFTPGQPESVLGRDRGLLGQPQVLRLILDSDGSGHELYARIGSHFQLFERSLGTLDRRGPTTLEVPLGDMTSWRHFGGEDDGLVRYPLRLVQLILRQRGPGTEGRLALDRVEVDTDYDPAAQTLWVTPAVAGGDPAAARFTVEVRSLADRPLPGTLDWSLHTVDRRLRSGTQPLTVPPHGVPAIATIAGAAAEAEVVEGRFRFEAGGLGSPEASVTLARLPAAAPDRALDPASRMGAGLYLYRFRGHPEAADWLERMCDCAARAGVKWTREEFHWNWIEPQRGSYDFEFFDRLVETARSHGISVYALCCYWTSWTRPYTEEGIEDYCRYLSALVRRYGDRIRHWEIWNEPNVFFWSGPKELYATLLRRAYETIKAADPAAQVLGCSTAGIDTGFIRKVLQAGGPLDALTVHPYRGTLDPPGFIRELQAVRELVGGRDVWITEMGWSSQLGGLSERQQAQHVARTYISALASGAARTVAWYDFREDGDDPFYNEHRFGLVRSDLSPKLGYRALAAVGRLLGRAEFLRCLDLGPGRLAFQFRAGPQYVTALWSAAGAELVLLSAGGAAPRILNLAGEPAHHAACEGAAALVLDPDTPVYVISDEPAGPTVRPGPARVVPDRPAVHPGEPVGLRIEHRANVDVAIVAPPGWSAAPDAATGGRVLTPPPTARPGRHVLRAEVTIGAAVLELPVEIDVVPALLRG